MQAPGDVRPRFRQDLIAELVEDGGARFIDVVAPDSDNVFRFYEVEYSIACAMDGERDVAGIVKWATEELGVTPSPKEVQSVIATLVDLRFIDTGAVAADAKVAQAAPTQPAKQAPAETGLAKGVVVGATTPARAPAPAADVELGASGAKPQPKSADLPKAPDFDLGAPGAPPVAAPPRAPVEDIALGAPGSRGEPAKPKAPVAPVAPVSDIGMDLSAHMDVGAADVKDAVRKSKAMTAVDVPKELLEAEAPKEPEKQPTKQAEPVAAKGNEKPGKGKTEAEKKAQSERDKAAAAEKKAAAAAKAEQDEKDKQAAKAAPADKAQDKADKKADKSEKKADKAQDKAAADRAAANKSADKGSEKKADKKPAVELPKRPATDRPVAPPAPAGGVSPVLVVMLILAIVGAGTFFVWKFVLSDAADPPPKASMQPPKPLPPPPPVDVMSKLAVEAQPAQAVKSPVAGTIETIESEKEVKAGDVVAVLAGGKPLATEIANLTKQLETAAPALEAATKELEAAQQKPDNQAGVTAAQAKVDRLKKPLDEKKATLETKKGEVDKLQIKAATDGKHTPVVKVGQKVAVDEQIAQIERPSMMVASFKVPPGTKMAADGNLSVVAGTKTIVCTVIDAQAETVKVSCPADGLAAGADVKFTLPK